MNIRFPHSIELELIETVDAEGNPDQTSLESFAKNETLEVELVGENEGKTEFQTGDGSVFFIEDDSFEEVE